MGRAGGGRDGGRLTLPRCWIAEHERALASGGFSPDVTRRLREGIERCERSREHLQALRDVITTRPTRPMI